MSGLYPSQHGVWNNVNVSNALSRDLEPGVRLWSEDLTEAGYAMDYSGKWHVSACDSPAERGWRTRYVGHPPGSKEGSSRAEFVAKGWGRYEGFREEEGPREEGQIIRSGYPPYRHYSAGSKGNDERIVADALEVIERRANDDAAGQPWCQFVSVNGPHDPYVAPEEFLRLYEGREIPLPENFHDPMADKPGLYRRTRDVFAQLGEGEHREALRHYLAYCSFVDALFGQVMTALEEGGQLENTIVVYLSDHGDYMGEHGLWCKGLPCFTPAYHVPLVVAHPDCKETRSRDVDALVSLADLAPTILQWAGLERNRTFLGRSLCPLIQTGDVPDGWRDAIFTQSNGNELYGIQRSVMTRDWRFTFNGFDYDELYDLRSDPGETRNVIDDPQHADTVRQQCEQLWRFARETGDDCVNPYIMVGLARHGPGVAFG